MTSLHSRIRNRALSVLARRGPSIADICIRREVLCPAEDQETPPGICDPRDFERVSACEPTTTMDEERARMAGARRSGCYTCNMCSMAGAARAVNH